MVQKITIMEGMIGEIRLFAGTFAPKNWAFCNGQIINISQNSALFSILGTTYGGNGTTTFGLPQLQGKTALGPRQGPGLSNYALGQTEGVENVTLNINQMPAHTHIAMVAGGMQTGTGKGETGNPQGNYIDDSTIATDLFKTLGGGPIMRGGEGISVTNFPAGGNQPHYNLMPYTVLNYVICMYGVFPQRN
jgi:microcystin-dependent protein